MNPDDDITPREAVKLFTLGLVLIAAIGVLYAAVFGPIA